MKCFIRKCSLNAKESSKGGIEQQKRHEIYRKQKSKIADINPTISVFKYK